MIPYVTINLPEIFGFPIQIFGIMVAIGFLAGDYLSRKRTLEVGLDPAIMKNVVLISIFLGLFSAHLFDTMFYEPRIFFTDFKKFLDFRTRLSSMGGGIGGGLCVWFYLWRKNKSFLEYSDVIMFGYIPGWFFGRVGCFLVHDHPGRLTDFFLGVKFPGGVRHDLGFYDALILASIWLVLFLFKRSNFKKPFHGFYMALCFILYAPGRFLCDFLRIHDSKMGSLTFAQYVCVGVFLIGISLMIWGYRKKSLPRG